MQTFGPHMYGLESVEFSKLNEVSEPGESYSCLVVVQNVNILEFKTKNVLQLILADDTLSDFR